MNKSSWLHEFINERIQYYEKYLSQSSKPGQVIEVRKGLDTLRNLNS